MMAVLKDCLELIPQHYGEVIDLAQLPEDDEVYETLQRVDSVRMFQVESRAQMPSLPRNYPRKFYDLVVHVAIIRSNRREDDAHVHATATEEGRDHLSSSILGASLKTHVRCAALSEQLLRIAMTVANFSGAEAEELRRLVRGTVRYLGRRLGIGTDLTLNTLRSPSAYCHKYIDNFPSMPEYSPQYVNK